jgi:hypothetical protein
MRKPIIILLGIFFLGGLALLAFTRQAPPQPPQETATLVPAAPTLYFQSPKNVSFVFDTTPTIPSALPTYLYEDYPVSLLESTIRTNLSLYAIPASPSSLIRADTKTVTWSRDGADFVLTTTPRGSTIIFHQQRAIARPSPSLSPTDAARAFITKLFPALPSGIALTRVGSLGGPFDGLFVLDNFPFTDPVGELFSYTIEGRPVISLSESAQQASVIVDGNGIVRSATIFPPPQSITRATVVPLITKEDVLANLTEGRASIVSAYNEETAGTGGALTFTSFRIKEVAVAYAKQDNLLLPSLLISGVGTGASGQTQEATYFLWAFKTPQTTPAARK